MHEALSAHTMAFMVFPGNARCFRMQFLGLRLVMGDGAGSPGANSRELKSGPRAEVPLVAESGSTLAVFPTFSLPLVPPTGRT